MLTVKAHLRYFLHRPLQLTLTVFGIALGVAVVTAVDLANTSAQRAFTLSMTEVMGNTTHQVFANNVDGIAEVKYRDFRMQFGRHSHMRSAPVIEGVVSMNDQHFRLLGVDVFSERHFRANVATPVSGSLHLLLTQPNTIMISEETSERLSINAGDTVKLKIGVREEPAEVVGIIASSVPAAAESLIICDITTAQELLQRAGFIDRIDLIIPGDDPQLLVTVKNWLPREMHIENAFSQSNTRLQTTRAFQINLRAMSLMAVLVGGFLIFNTLTFSILQRRHLIGILRGIGVTRNQIFLQIITEATVLGLVGASFGLLLGIAIGSGLIKLVLRTINDLYFVTNVAALTLTWDALFKGAAIGLVVSVTAALSPAWEASGTTPVMAQRRSTLEKHIHSSMSAIMFTGFGIMLTSAICLVLTEDLVYAFSFLFLFVVGYCITLAPGIIMLFKVLSPLIKRTNLLVRLAVRSIPASLSRSAVAVAALTVAVSATIGVGVMVHSFRYTVEKWLQSTLTGDIYLSAPDSAKGRAFSTMPVQLTRHILAVDGVKEVTTTRNVQLNSNLGVVQVIAINPPQNTDNRPPLYRGDPDGVWHLFDQGGHVLVSEPFSRRYRVKTGSLIELYTDTGRQKFLVGGVVQDYRSDQGMIFIHRSSYEKFWQDTEISSIGIYLSEKADIARIKDRIGGAIAPYPGIVMHSNKEIMKSSLEIFDRTFTITDVLRLLALGVAFFGIFSALLAFQLERVREIAILRATGLTGRQVWIVIGSHTGLIGLLSGLFAIPLGLILAWVLVNVINEIAFGWSMEMVVSFGSIFQGIVLALVASLLAAVYPAWRMSVISPAYALREE